MRAMKWVIHGLCLFLMCASVAQTHGQDVRKAVLLKTADWPEKLVNELSKKFKSDCPKYDITSDQNHFDYSIVTGHGLAVYDKADRSLVGPTQAHYRARSKTFVGRWKLQR